LARLFADENFPNPTVERLRQLGHDVLTVANVDMGGLHIPCAAHRLRHKECACYFGIAEYREVIPGPSQRVGCLTRNRRFRAIW
jgi:Domain of unknown function (DUF5615)